MSKDSSAVAIDLGPPGLSCKVSSFARKNKDKKYEKPIEDFHIADHTKNIFVLMDGATRFVRGSVYPNPSPAAVAARLISESIHEVLSNILNTRGNFRELLITALKNANELMRNHNAKSFPEIDYLENDYANACGIAGFIKDGKFSFAYLGDPQGYLIRGGKITSFTENQTAKIDELYSRFSLEISKDLIEFRKYVCGSVRNNIKHEHSFGSLTGEDTAFDLLQFGEIPLLAGDKLILTSDGLLTLFQKKPELYLEGNYETLFDEMEGLENALNIRSDDKTLIAIEIK